MNSTTLFTFSVLLMIDIRWRRSSFLSKKKRLFNWIIKSSILSSSSIATENGSYVSSLLVSIFLINSVNKRRRPIPSGIPDTITAFLSLRLRWRYFSRNLSISVSRPTKTLSSCLISGHCSQISLLTSSSILRARNGGWI